MPREGAKWQATLRDVLNRSGCSGGLKLGLSKHGVKQDHRSRRPLDSTRGVQRNMHRYGPGSRGASHCVGQEGTRGAIGEWRKAEQRNGEAATAAGRAKACTPREAKDTYGVVSTTPTASTDKGGLNTSGLPPGADQHVDEQRARRRHPTGVTMAPRPRPSAKPPASARGRTADHYDNGPRCLTTEGQRHSGGVFPSPQQSAPSLTAATPQACLGHEALTSSLSPKRQASN